MRAEVQRSRLLTQQHLSTGAGQAHGVNDNDVTDTDTDAPTISFTIFTSGKMVLTGARRFEDLASAFDATKDILYSYRLPLQPSDPIQTAAKD